MRRRGVVRSLGPGSTIEGPARLTQVCVRGDLKAIVYGQAAGVLETTFFGYRDL